MMNETRALSQKVAELLGEKKLKVATAESLTAGMIASTIADIPGSSAWLDRGWIVYCNDAKEALGVPKETLEQYGAVSKECAIQLAEAALKHSKADIAVSATGLAGPGDCDGITAGTFFIGCATKRHAYAFRWQVCGERNEVRERAVQEALTSIIEEAKFM